MWQPIKELIERKDTFLLTTHINPDGDGLGSACALIELLLSLGKRVRFVSDSTIAPKYQFLDPHNLFSEYGEAEDYSTDVLIVLDTHKKERIGRLAAVCDHPDTATICIDHHEGHDHFATATVNKPTACSTGALIYALYKALGFPLNKNAATGIYAAVFCDTGRFSYSSTSLRAHKIAEDCIKLGVDPDEMYERLFQHVPIGQVRVFARALERMELFYEGKVLVQQIFREDYEEEGVDLESVDLEYIHEFNKWIEGVECVVLLHELPNGQIRVSMRSKHQLDLIPIVESIGGGGHMHAAGAIWMGEMQSIKNKILKILKPLLDPVAL